MITATHKGKYYSVEYSIVNVSELEGELRIDAEYYKPRYLKIESKILKRGSKFFCLKPVIIHPSEIKRIYISNKEGIEMIMAQNIRNNELDFSQKFIMPKTVRGQLKKNKLTKFDILMTRTGANYGQTAPYLEENEMYASADCLIIRVKEINPLFVSTYFNTTYGQVLVKRIAYGLAQPHIAPVGVKMIAVPIPSEIFQKFIEKLVLKAYEERQKAEQLYKQTEEILLEELGLKNWKPKTKKIKIGGQEFEEEKNISIRMLSDVIKVDRLDAEYWEPKYDEIEKIVKNYKNGWDYLNNLVRFIDHGKQPPYDENGEFYVFSQKYITEHGINYYFYEDKEIKRTSKNFVLKNRKYLMEKGKVVHYSVGANIGRAACVLKDLKAIPGSFITIMEPIKKKINSETLAMLLNSIVGRYQTYKNKSATAQQYIYPKDIKKFIIPLIDPQTQQKISQLIQQSLEARERSKKLLEIAKRAVEIYIEKDEKEGLNYAKEQTQRTQY